MTIRASQYAHMDGLCSSPEILAAIEEVAGVDFDADDGAQNGTDDSAAYRIWSSPTDAEMTQVVALAWAMADADEDTLRWGIETLRRNSEAA